MSLVYSMGMFCADELHFPEKSYTDIIGGAGTFASLGAGLHLSHDERKQVGFVLDEGSDFTPEMHDEITKWNMQIKIRQSESRKTTRAWNKFLPNETRLFKYLSPSVRIEPQDLPAEGHNAKVLHLICSPLRCLTFLEARPENQMTVWEPVPTSCTVEEFPNLKIACSKGITILSPNALEAASFVGLPEPTTRFQIESLAQKHFSFVPVLVIRCGCLGSYLQTKTITKWFSAYYEIGSKEVVDPCGAGNAFCGGLGLGLALNLDWDRVLGMASVSSSFMIQQIGPPHYDPERDLWNNEKPGDRLNYYLNSVLYS